jgi:vacuolar-type H+-ATPase subunit F/Vma7
VVVLGEAARVDGFALAGANVVRVEDPAAVRRAWTGLSEEVEVVVLTAAAAAALDDSARSGSRMLSVVMPP